MAWWVPLVVLAALLGGVATVVIKEHQKSYPSVSAEDMAVAFMILGVTWLKNREKPAKYFTEIFEKEMQSRAGSRLHQNIPIFQEELGNWPKVFRQTNNSTSAYTVVASVYTPENRRGARMGAIFIAVVGGLILLSIATGNGRRGDELAWALGLAAVASVGLYKGGQALLEQTLRTHLTMVFSGGEITWEGLRRNWWGGRIKEVVRSTEKRQLKAGEHRKAAAERRDNEDRRMRGVRLKRPMYQQASELLMVTGPLLSTWRPVAELADDEHFEKAGQLSAAIQLADSAAQGMLEGMQAQLLRGLHQDNAGLFGGGEPRSFR